jgi:uncharacterized protein (DUF2252 family)
MARIKLKTTEEREVAGKALRDKCPRTSHGEKVLGQGAKRDIVSLIKESNKDRLENLVPVRHGRMLQSPFAFFRGTAALQAYDLHGTPSSGIIVQACGDCHLANFGGFGTPERTIVFDINDFDETLPAPFEWDIKRLATSFVVAARWRGFAADDAREAAVEAVTSYRASMRKRSGAGVLAAWYSKITADDFMDIGIVDAETVERIEKKIDKAQKQGHEQSFNRLTAPTRGLPRIVDQPPLIFHADKRELNEKIATDFFKVYRDTLAPERRMLFDRFQYVDIAVKVVGVGSVGTRCMIALMMAAPDDPLFLQIKEARPSVLEHHVKGAKVKHNGERIVVGQRLMQSASDIFLGWSKGPKGTGRRDFYVRQLRDMKISPDIELMTKTTLKVFAKACGMALARAHDKAGDAAMIAGYLGNKDTFDEAIADYAVAYADQVERDFASFSDAVRNGKLKSDLSPSDLTTALR